MNTYDNIILTSFFGGGHFIVYYFKGIIIIIINRRSGITSQTGTRSMQPVRSVPLGGPVVS